MQHFNVGANLFRGVEAVGGKLKITDEGLFFKPHAINVQTEPVQIPFQAIAKVEKVNTMGIVPNGMLITAKDGTKYRFVINHRKKIIEFLETKLKL